MIDERFPDAQPDQKLMRLVRKFSVLEGRQPRAMVCHARESFENGMKEISVDLAGFGFDVDLGIPFESFRQLGRNAIENDADVLILLGLQEDLSREFLTDLKVYLSEKGYSDLLILHRYRDELSRDFKADLIPWLEQVLQ